MTYLNPSAMLCSSWSLLEELCQCRDIELMQVLANDLNPRSVHYLQENIKLNKVYSGNCDEEQRSRKRVACLSEGMLRRLATEFRLLKWMAGTSSGGCVVLEQRSPLLQSRVIFTV